LIIIDENIDRKIIQSLIDAGFEVLSIKERYPGISDKEIIELARSSNGIVLTEDKDFGELVFSYQISDCSVIFLRYKKTETREIIKALIHTIGIFITKPGLFFITITSSKIRVRSI
jgi:predicted nuclease of predicted toxin-antitoxin system